MRSKLPDLKGMTKEEKLAKFITEEVYQLEICANDVFAWAMADIQPVNVERIWEIIDLWEKYGNDGITAVMAVARGYEPQQPLIDLIGAQRWDDIYREARGIDEDFTSRILFLRKDNSPVYDDECGFGFRSPLQPSQEACDRIKELEKSLGDDPLMDSTDFAHPAWWRGQDSAIQTLCNMMQKWVDGKDIGGIVPDKTIQIIKDQVEFLVSENFRLKRENRNLQQYKEGRI